MQVLRAHSRGWGWARAWLAVVSLAAGVLMGMGLSHGAGGDIVGEVVRVLDGDTVTLLVASSKETLRVRLAEIDAPEKSQPFGKRSKQSLSDLVFGRTVRVEQQSRDRYGRLVGRLLLHEMDANAEQIRRGMAWVYRRYSRSAVLLRLEEEARKAQRGLWADAQPQPPWEYRRAMRTQGRAEPSRASLAQPSGRRAAAATAASSAGAVTRMCGSKRSCKAMTSCEEARFFLTECHVATLDGDGDGVPCESLCR